MTYARNEYLPLPVPEFIHTPKHDSQLPKEPREKSNSPLNAIWLNAP